jgi:hypothetical protein
MSQVSSTSLCLSFVAVSMLQLAAQSLVLSTHLVIAGAVLCVFLSVTGHAYFSLISACGLAVLFFRGNHVFGVRVYLCLCTYIYVYAHTCI